MMRNFFYIYSIILSLLSSTFAFASYDSEKFNSYVLCRNQKVVRTIRIEKSKDDKAWVAYYTKLGVDKEVARAQAPDSCIKVVDNIKENLTKANWKCKDLQKVSATTTSLSE